MQPVQLHLTEQLLHQTMVVGVSLLLGWPDGAGVALLLCLHPLLLHVGTAHQLHAVAEATLARQGKVQCEGGLRVLETSKDELMKTLNGAYTCTSTRAS